MPSFFSQVPSLADVERYLEDRSLINHVYFFSQKKKPAALLKALSSTFKGQLRFAFVTEENQDVVAKYAVKSFPHLLVVKSVAADGSRMAKEKVVRFKGTEMSLGRLVEFLEPFALDKPLLDDVPAAGEGAKGTTGGTTKGERRR